MVGKADQNRQSLVPVLVGIKSAVGMPRHQWAYGCGKARFDQVIDKRCPGRIEPRAIDLGFQIELVEQLGHVSEHPDWSLPSRSYGAPVHRQGLEALE